MDFSTVAGGETQEFVEDGNAHVEDHAVAYDSEAEII